MAQATDFQILSGSFTGTGRSDWLVSDSRNKGIMTYQITGTFVATVDIQRSSDDGNTWDDVVGETFTIPADGNITTGSDAFVYSLNCSAFTSGTINFVLAQ